MGIRYDTAEIRKCARRVQQCADQVQNDLMHQVQKTSRLADEASRSETEQAIQGRLETIGSDLKRSYRHLSGMAESMYRYADMLDEADRAAQKLIQSK